ncbi:rhodanese-like domain-containing protein [Oceanihabitans sediminis]|uniref:Rhodanese-like domain-containing protein n=1 Tax=Oceanihabitans sediminis TaxID=1812012 RepID=A0A368P8F5_9FLAO|nr:rhodanese-like domain-containing protein [Oceanihabitans sediminis]MDX1279133.1 rhodanese-like domain-containing protein [Oceanihabitans sediminis]MDX1773947.1 rhodanese-like domain-containing protein [Oceanihabitans sediminis]RBP32027.1 rhodanese-related sulfurtransferase [Oceanihabitans sediminis]RCU58683.1 rhodanese-like domain-containing protein [Oceanihabitans sediminis]
MKKSILYIFVLLFSAIGFSQENLSELLNKLNTKSVPYISVQELAMPKTKAIILDAREIDEFQISHIKGAFHIGFNNFNLEETSTLLKNKQEHIVVYCSLGVRSERIAEQLHKAGYTNVRNLYGGIFEWKNNNFPTYNLEKEETDDVHTFSEEWSKWLHNGNKIYPNPNKNLK